MTADRPYQTPRPVPDAIDELRRCAGTQFDPAVVAALVDELRTVSSVPGGPSVAAGMPAG